MVGIVEATILVTYNFIHIITICFKIDQWISGAAMLPTSSSWWAPQVFITITRSAVSDDHVSLITTFCVLWIAVNEFVEVEIWTSNYIHVKRWGGITNPCPNFSSGLVKPPLKWGRGWVITSHTKQWMYLIIHALISEQYWERHPGDILYLSTWPIIVEISTFKPNY